jgi:uncharacterized membrane protein
MATKKPIVARLTIVVEYDTYPEVQEVQSAIEQLREYGDVIIADLVIVAETKVSLA